MNSFKKDSNPQKPVNDIQSGPGKHNTQLTRLNSQASFGTVPSLPDAILYQDLNLIYRRSYKNSDRFQLETPEGKSDFDFFPLEEAKKSTNLKKRVIKNGNVESELLTNNLGPKSQTLFLEYHPWIDADGKVIGVVSHIHVVSKSQMTAEMLTRQLFGESLLATIASEFLRTGSDEIGEKLCQSLGKIGDYLEADLGFIRFIDLKENKILPGYEWKSPSLPYLESSMPGTSFDQFKLMKKQLINNLPIYVPEVFEIPPEGTAERNALQQMGLESLVILPIFIGEELCGYLGFGAKKYHPFWSEREKSYLELFKNIIVSVLERQDRERLLQEGRNLYQKVVELSPSYIFIVQNEKLLYINPTSVRRLGFADNEILIGERIDKIIPIEIVEDCRKKISDLAKGEKVTKHEISFQNREGSTIEVDYNAIPLTLYGKPATLTVATDISQRKQIEREIENNRLFLQQILDFSPMGIYVFDNEKDSFTFFNNAIKNLFPEISDGLGKQDILKHLRDEDRLKVAINLKKISLLPVSEFIEDEYCWITSDGDPVWLHAIITPIEKSADGSTTKSLTIVQNINDFKKAQEELRRNEEKHRGLVASIPGLVYQASFREPHQIDFLSPYFEKLTGYSQVNTFPVNVSIWEELIHPEDYQNYLNEIEEALSTKRPLILEYRIHHANGEYIWVMDSGSFSYDANNHPVAIIGIVMDISARKRDYEAMRVLSQDNLRLLAKARHEAGNKTLLLNEVNHRVKNNITSIIGLLELEKQHEIATPDEFKSSINGVISRITSLARVHDILSSNQWTPMQMELFIQMIIEGASASAPPSLTISIDVYSPERNLWINTRQATGLALILNELTTNSIKHAFRGKKKGMIKVTIGRDPENINRVIIRYADDGPGWPDDILNGTKEDVGIEVIRLSASSPLNGEIGFENDNGAVATIKFKLVPQKELLRINKPAPSF